jgi:hypothetical protein
MPLNKQQLEVVNQTNFPNNNGQLITPALLRDFNSDIIEAIQLTGSYATTGANTFVGNQTITGDLTVSGVISASVLHVQYETASVIFSTGSNQLGDELTDTQTLSGSVKVQGSLTVNGVPVLTGSVSVDTGSLVTTASFNAYTASNNQRVSSLEANSASVNISITNVNAATASLFTSVNSLNSFTASQLILNGQYATTGSNTFTGNQVIDRASKLYTNGIYWTDVTAGFNNLEIINQGGGNLDFASLNNGKIRFVSSSVNFLNSPISSSNDISTSANIYAANLTGSTLPSGLLSSSVTNFTDYSASVDSRINAITGSGTINTGSFATTGSNTFTGNQTYLDSGSNSITQYSVSGSIGFAPSNIDSFFNVSASFASAAPSARLGGNILLKNNTLATGSLTISGSGNLVMQMPVANTGFRSQLGGNNLVLQVPNISASMAFPVNINSNVLTGGITMRGPVSSSTWFIQNNNNFGTISIGSSAANNAEKAVAGFSLNNNTGTATLNFIANRAFHTQGNQIANNILTGVTTFNAASSSIIYNNNIGTPTTITNGASGSGAAIVSQSNALYVVSNLFAGLNHTITASGSSDPSDARGLEYMREVGFNTILGNSNVITLPYDLTGSNTLHSTLIAGLSLAITGSSPGFFSTPFIRQGGSAFLGRYNAQDGNKAQSASTIFAVGTGISNGNRKTGFLIDSGSNTFVEGSLNVSGNATITGSLNVSGSNTILSSSVSIRGNTTFTTIDGRQGDIILGDNAMANSVGVTVSIAIGGSSMRYASGSTQNVAIGQNALLITSGSNNFAIGSYAMENNTTGNENTAIGTGGLNRNTTGGRNVGIGGGALFFNQDGGNNVAIGYGTGQYVSSSSNVLLGYQAGANMSGSRNVILGGYTGAGDTGDDNIILATGGGTLKARYDSGWSFKDKVDITGSTNINGNLNVSGNSTFTGSLNVLNLTRGINNNNTALGANVLQNAISGGNVAVGTNTLFANTSGTDNIAFGDNSLFSNISGDRNMAIGSNTLEDNTTGTLNVAIGNATLASLVDGNANVGIGFEALKNQTTSDNNVGIGRQALNQNISGSGNIAFGAYAGYNETGSGNFYVGNANYGSLNADRSGSLMWGKMDTFNALDQTLQINASVTIQSGSSFYANGNKQFNVGAFSSLVTQSGSAGVSQSVNFEVTDISEGVSVVSNSRITLANSGTYSITFSAQLKEIGGTDSIYLWLKKNGTNVANTGTKTVVRNNDENIMTVEYIVQSSASDYYEIVYQNLNGHAQLYYEAASGNIPATPSIIITVKQVR